jgi:hypothetical protein
MLLLCLAASALRPAAAAPAGFYLPGPTSPVYWNFVAVGGASLQVQQSCRLTGNLQSNGPLALGQGDQVTGNVSAVGQVTNHGTVTGTVTSAAPAQALPALPTQAQAAAIANRVFTTNTTFKNAEIDDVVFVEGDVHVQGSLDGRGTLIVLHDLQFDGTDAAHPIPLAATTRLSILALHDIHVGQLRPLRGLVFAGHDAQLQSQASLEGVAVAAHDLTIEQGARLAFFALDGTPPAVSILAPVDGSLLANALPTISATYTDDLSGVDPATLHVALDGADITAACQVAAAAATCVPPQPLAAGGHSLGVSVKDRAGNTGAASSSFTLMLEAAPPVVTLTLPLEGATVHTASVAVLGTVIAQATISSVTVNGQGVALQGGAFSTQVTLTQGLNLIQVLATDANGAIGAAAADVILDTTPPVLTVSQPAAGGLINAAGVQIVGQATDDNGIGGVKVAGHAVTVHPDGTFQVQVSLAEGSNAIALQAFDLAGNETDQTLTLVRFSLPEVAITSPADLSYIAATTVTVSGTVSDPAATVSVNGQPATVAGGTFMATGVPLLEGGNILTVTAANAAGHVNTATINVVRDLTPPHLAIAYPQDGTTVFDPAITVSGMVNDIVAGTVNASQASVTVNGQAATVANRSFVASAALVQGSNLIMVQAKDVSGNTAQATVTVTLQAATVPRVALVAGGGQAGVIGMPLGAPLVAALVDASGHPVAGQKLFFKVRGNNGSLDGGQRGLAMTTDAAGHAAVHFTLGTRAGAGSQVVEAFAPGFAGPAAFQETALPGNPALIVVDTGDQQVGIPGQPAPRPLVAVVTDSGYNRLGGVQVQFAVSKGQGSFANGQQTVVASTDSDGRAIVTFLLDPAEGISNNGVRAAIVGLAGGPVASFALSGRAAGDPAATTVSGVVLDNAQQPVPGVTVSIRGTTLNTQTDGAGHFQLQAVPPGTVTLIVDGSTAQRPGAWPDLEYFVTVIPGRDNTVNMPIYLLPLDLGHGAQVSETTGATLTLPDVPGFALEIAPGSVTFPNGSRSGLVSVTVVHADRVPMVPNFGQQPRLIVTIQPAGARFDPPARLTLPNVDGLAPGSVTEMYSFDHDLGHFVSIGPATVSDDGATVTANPGVGVIKAGWHCCGNPATAGAAAKCPDCQKCDGGPECVTDSSQQGLPCQHEPSKICRGGNCVCAYPVNFRETSRSTSGDVLIFVYKWDSSTGKLSDLDLEHCQIGEQVVYPTDPNNASYTWPPPFSGSTPNPTVVLGNASAGVFDDTHDHLPIVPPYVTVSFTAQQRYIYTCDCKPGINVLAGIWPIVRTISKRPDEKFVYTITKNGLSAQDNPLPIIARVAH